MIGNIKINKSINIKWQKLPAKISYSTLIQPISEGGLGLIDFEQKCRALTQNWIKRYCLSEGNWKCVPALWLQKF